ncbi:MAG: serine/threonine protein phosphatase [Candidatus Lambdaproteobacteria bacterium]|nr:serine/threonine protein phosphatase [Candidatus Lambdaproteobacteria bacterium]
MPIAIGDIHGCLGPLDRLIARLPPHGELIFLGDYIDRGPDSAAVVRYLRRLALQRPCRFLKGNHEALLEAALRDPAEIPLWLQNGGDATLRSYGVELGALLRAGRLPDFAAHDRPFFEALEPYIEDDRTVFVHAGLDPRLATMAEQVPEVLLWIREAFFRRARDWHGKDIVFGHTPTLSLGLPPGEIFQAHALYGIDTGCVYGGVLTALDSATHRLYQEPSNFNYLRARMA